MGHEQTLPEVHVQPGECRLVRQPSVLRTVLGSCVGVTFFVPRLGVGAMCHPMLPVCPAKRKADMTEASCRRYVDFAIRETARRLEGLGAGRGETQVKLFGGCDVLPVARGAGRPTVGALNAEAARRVLADEGFVVSAARLGGKAGVQIHFRTDNGEVLLRQLSASEDEEGEPLPRKRGRVVMSGESGRR